MLGSLEGGSDTTETVQDGLPWLRQVFHHEPHFLWVFRTVMLQSPLRTTADNQVAVGVRKADRLLFFRLDHPDMGEGIFPDLEKTSEVPGSPRFEPPWPLVLELERHCPRQLATFLQDTAAFLVDGLVVRPPATWSTVEWLWSPIVGIVLRVRFRHAVHGVGDDRINALAGQCLQQVEAIAIPHFVQEGGDLQARFRVHHLSPMLRQVGFEALLPAYDSGEIRGWWRRQT